MLIRQDNRMTKYSNFYSQTKPVAETAVDMYLKFRFEIPSDC